MSFPTHPPFAIRGHVQLQMLAKVEGSMIGFIQGLRAQDAASTSAKDAAMDALTESLRLHKAAWYAPGDPEGINVSPKEAVRLWTVADHAGDMARQLDRMGRAVVAGDTQEASLWQDRAMASVTLAALALGLVVKGRA